VTDKGAALRLVLVGAVGVVGGALQTFLDAQDDLEVVAVAATMSTVQVASVVGAVALVLLYFDYLDQVPWSQLMAVRTRFPEATTVLLSRLDDSCAIEQAFRQGITALVDIRTNPIVFLEAIRRAARREPVVLVASSTSGVAVHPPPSRTSLTSREKQILEFVCAGLTSKQIASVLHVSVRTVSAHLQDAYRRLGVTSRLGAVEKARREGILR
jgi:DNA-binding NarL/FixJ family response regulator